jgi:hypothetical protein
VYKATSWRRVDPPAVAFFFLDGGFRVAANIWAKEPGAEDGSEGNPALSEGVWGDPSFEVIAYLDDVQEIDVSPDEFKEVLGYQPQYRIGRESVVPTEAIQDAAMAAFGSPDAFRDAVVGNVGTPPLDDLPDDGLPVHSLGTDYVPEDEEARAERAEIFRVDPDKIDRGTQAHRTIQNLLAAELRRRGLDPKQRLGPEPPYDLACQLEDGTILVAEIKSLTRQNEERQLRLALGQVLRYAQQLIYKQKPIQRVIAIERKPKDESWIELCASHDVRLVWPDTFSEL